MSKRKTYSPVSQSDSRSKIFHSDPLEETSILELLQGEFDIKDGISLLIQLNLKQNKKLEGMIARIDRIYSWVENLDEAIVNIETRLEDLEKKFTYDTGKILSDDRIDLENKLAEFTLSQERFECFLRRNNLIIFGLPESEDNNLQVKDVVLEFFQNKLSVDNVRLERCYRLGQQRKDSIRLIYCSFFDYGDKCKIKRAAFKLKGTRIFIMDDLPPLTRDIRKIMNDFAREKKRLGASITYLNNRNAVKVDNKIYKYNIVSKKMEEQMST
ncbi:uncharacterized protein LOC111639760 [Centruroides sculpturatus]|uniref:uncharacterized protein LOC111639760 n=1 Tax=Centruroides sculpturatus TaxID=218467 RepID=UPI000C6DB404|nr:uncharacterized protein LOC111639760 [Centruroides sculpturatus]